MKPYFLFFFLLTVNAYAGEIPERMAVRAIVGESSSQGYRGMLAVASGIRNRGTLKGVYGVKAKHISKEPKWVFRQAKRAWVESKANRLHTGTHWGSKRVDKRWIARMEKAEYKKIYEYKDHIFYREK